MSDAGIQVLIVEDHAVVAEGLVALLSEHPDLHVLGWASTVAAAGGSRGRPAGRRRGGRLLAAGRHRCRRHGWESASTARTWS